MSIWCRPTFVRQRASGRKVNGREWEKKEIERKRQTENKTKQAATILESWPQRTGIHSRVKISLDLIWRGRCLGNYGTGTEAGETELSQEEHCRILLLGLLGHCNLNLLSRWTGLRHRFSYRSACFCISTTVVFKVWSTEPEGKSLT